MNTMYIVLVASFLITSCSGAQDTPDGGFPDGPLGGTGGVGSDPDDPTISGSTIKITVLSHPDLFVSDQTVNNKIQQMNQALSEDSDDGSRDSHCCLRFELKEHIKTQDVPKSIDVLQQLIDLTLDNPTDSTIILVEEINVCSRVGDGILGCTGQSNDVGLFPSFVDIEAEGGTWLHEIGHTQGLPDISRSDEYLCNINGMGFVPSSNFMCNGRDFFEPVPGGVPKRDCRVIRQFSQAGSHYSQESLMCD